MPGEPRVIEIDAAATHDLRGRVLRVGTTSSNVVFPEDAHDGTVHLGIDLDGRLVAVSTWIDRPHPQHDDVRGRQLRGMATAPTMRGRGLGSLLVLAGLDRADDADIAVVWANARTTAIDFYLAHGFDIDGEEFLGADTGLPHRLISRWIGRPAHRPA